MKKIVLIFIVNCSLNLFCQERFNLDYLASKYTLSSFEGFKKLHSTPFGTQQSFTFCVFRKITNR